MSANCARGAGEFGYGWTIIDELLDGHDSLTALVKGFGLELDIVKPTGAMVSVKDSEFLEVWLTEHPRPYSNESQYRPMIWYLARADMVSQKALWLEEMAKNRIN